MLQTRNLSCERNDVLLFEALTLHVRPGQLLRVTGGNGSGKSTLLRILCGLFSDYGGDVEWNLDDHPLYVGHRPGVKDLLTPVENLRWLSHLFGASVTDEPILGALDGVDLGHCRDRLCGALSEGQRKRVNLARLFLLESPAWILDEPFSAIDAAGVDRLSRAMESQLEGGGIVLLTSHQAVEGRFDEIVVRLGA